MGRGEGASVCFRRDKLRPCTVHYINVCTQTRLALFHPTLTCKWWRDPDTRCRKGGRTGGRGRVHHAARRTVLLYCSRQRQSALSYPLPMLNPRFPTPAVLWRSRTHHAGVCSVYSTTNASSRFHVDSEIADTLIKRRFPRHTSCFVFSIWSDMGQRRRCYGKQRRRWSGQCCSIHEKLIRK